MALRLPPGRDLLVLVFFMPWVALAINLAITLTVSKAVVIVLFLKHMWRMRLSRIPGFELLVVIVALGMISAVTTVSTIDETIIVEGGDFRNGILRSVVQLGSTVLQFIPIFLIFSLQHRVDPMALFRTYVLSCGFLALIGLWQYAYWWKTGTDPIPIASFTIDVGHTGLRSGMYSFLGETWLRISSLGGEPKGLGVSLVLALLILITIGKRLIEQPLLRLFTLGVILVALLLTFSTSAFVLGSLGLIVLTGFRIFSRPLDSHRIYAVVVGGGLLLLGIYFYNVSVNQFRTNYGPEAETFAQLISKQTIERIEVEDHDYILIQSFLDDPFRTLPLGYGFGLAHYYTTEFAPIKFGDSYTNYVAGGKSGITVMLENCGLLGVVLHLFFLAGLVVVSNRAVLQGGSVPRDLVMRLQALAIAVVFAVLLRSYVIESGYVLLGLVSLMFRYPRAP